MIYIHRHNNLNNNISSTSDNEKGATKVSVMKVMTRISMKEMTS